MRSPKTFIGKRPQLAPRPFGRRDALLLGLILAGVFYFLYYFAYVYPYNWKWAEMPQFIAHRDEHGHFVLGILGRGFLTTLRLSFWAAAGAFVWGLALAMARLSAWRYFRLLAVTAIEAARNLPPLVLIFIVYYFLSDQLLPWDVLTGRLDAAPPFVGKALAFFVAPSDELSAFLPAVLTLAIYEGAYFAEIFRGGIISIGQGQWEASWCLGLGRWGQYRRIILPQVFHRVRPQLAGQFISTIKDSAIVSVISIAELTFSGSQLAATLRQPFEVWLMVAAAYLLLNASLSKAFRYFED